MDGMGHDATQDIVEVGPGIDVAGFAGLDESEVERRRLAATLTAGEEPVLAVMLSSA